MSESHPSENPMTNPNSLVVFARVAEANSFSGAARILTA
jgi:hypothetical protein